MKTEVKIVTPELAQQWLSNKKENRKLRPSFIQFLASEIKRGDFQLTHQGIAFDENKKLIDGQHRLEAILLANQPVEMMVTYNMPSYRFPILDMGIIRTASDILGIPASYIQVYRCLREVSQKHVQGKFSMGDLRKMDEYLHDTINLMEAYCKGNNRYYSSSAIRTAIVVTLIFGGEKEYILEMYKNLVYQHLDKLPSIGQALVRYLYHHPFAIKGVSARWELFFMAMYVFDKSTEFNTKLRITQNHKDKYMSLANKLLKQCL